MALAFANVGGIRASDGGPIIAQTSMTLDASYAAGGVAVSAKQLGLQARVLGGHVGVNIANAGAVTSGTVVPQADGSAKIKLNVAAAELGAGAASGLIVDIVAFAF
jgi:hypothetical protein